MYVEKLTLVEKLNLAGERDVSPIFRKRRKSLHGLETWQRGKDPPGCRKKRNPFPREKLVRDCVGIENVNYEITHSRESN